MRFDEILNELIVFSGFSLPRKVVFLKFLELFLKNLIFLYFFYLWSISACHRQERKKERAVSPHTIRACVCMGKKARSHSIDKKERELVYLHFFTYVAR